MGAQNVEIKFKMQRTKGSDRCMKLGMVQNNSEMRKIFDCISI